MTIKEILTEKIQNHYDDTISFHFHELSGQSKISFAIDLYDNLDGDITITKQETDLLGNYYWKKVEFESTILSNVIEVDINKDVFKQLDELVLIYEEDDYKITWMFKEHKKKIGGE